MSAVFSSVNTPSSQPVTLDSIRAEMDLARQGYALAKDGAAKAAAHAYMVWLATLSPEASSDMRQAITAEFEAFNNKVAAHNDAEKLLKSRVKGLKDGKLKKEDPLLKDAETEAEKKAQKDDRANLEDLSGLEDPDWAKRKQIAIDLVALSGNDIKPSFAAIVRYTLGLGGVPFAPTVSRYATVLAWINDHFVDEVPADAAEIVKAINEAGSFEAVVNQYRGNDDGLADEAAEDRAAQRAEIIARAKNAVASAVAKGSVDSASDVASQGMVTMLGRVVDGKIEIICQTPVSDTDLDATVLQFADADLLPTHASSDFVSRVFSIGEAVHEGGKSEKTKDGTKAGPSAKEERAFSLLPHDKAGLQVVVSGLYGSASAIVKAIPNADRVNLGRVGEPVILTRDQQSELAGVVEAHTNRLLVDIAPVVGDAGFAWQSTDAALVAKGRNNAVKTFGFTSLADREVKPLDVDGFRPQATLVLAASDLRAFFNSSLKEWLKNKASDKSKKIMELIFSDGKLNYVVEGGQGFEMAATGKVAGKHSLKFRAYDFVDLVKVLLTTGVSTFNVKADTGGMMSVSFEDPNGTYEIFLPTATADGTMNPKRVEQMRVEAQIPLAA